MVCSALHTVTQAEIDLEGTLDNTVTATSDELDPVMASLSIPIGVFAHGFESSACPCWTLEDISALPVAGKQAQCRAGIHRFGIEQIDGCEHSYEVTFSASGTSCISKRSSIVYIGI